MNKNDCIKLLVRISKERKAIYEKIWQDVKLHPMALYSPKNDFILILNQDSDIEGFKREDGILVGKYENSFFGCTSINFKGQQIGIVDVDYYKDPISIEACLYHEAFHAHQCTLSDWDKHFSSVLEGILYPMNAENFTLKK